MWPVGLLISGKRISVKSLLNEAPSSNKTKAICINDADYCCNCVSFNSPPVRQTISSRRFHILRDWRGWLESQFNTVWNITYNRGSFACGELKKLKMNNSLTTRQFNKLKAKSISLRLFIVWFIYCVCWMSYRQKGHDLKKEQKSIFSEKATNTSDWQILVRKLYLEVALLCIIVAIILCVQFTEMYKAWTHNFLHLNVNQIQKLI